MRILYVLTCLGIGGAEKQVTSLAGRMAAKGHTVALIVLRHADEEWPIEIPVLRLNMSKSLAGVIKGLRFALKFKAAFRPDIIHSHTFPANIFARLMRIGSRAGGSSTRFVNTIHNVYEGGWHRMLLYRLTDPLVNAVTAVSTAAAERFVRVGAVPRRKMSVLTNGIDTSNFCSNADRRIRMRKLMGAGDSFVWLAVGRVAPAKDYPNLLRAFAEVSRSKVKVSLWIAGEGELATRHEVDPKLDVRFLGLRRDIADLLDAADGYVLSSAWEGLPLALGEAMAMEKLVVATDVGGVREMLGEIGELVPAADSSALAGSMLESMAMSDRERRASGRAARERIKKEFSLDARVEDWVKLYSELSAQEVV